MSHCAAWENMTSSCALMSYTTFKSSTQISTRGVSSGSEFPELLRHSHRLPTICQFCGCRPYLSRCIFSTWSRTSYISKDLFFVQLRIWTAQLGYQFSVMITCSKYVGDYFLGEHLSKDSIISALITRAPSSLLQSAFNIANSYHRKDDIMVQESQSVNEMKGTIRRVAQQIEWHPTPNIEQQSPTLPDIPSPSKGSVGAKLPTLL